jgi:tryptophan-rich sensory protein
MHIHNYFKLAISIVAPLMAGAIGSVFTAPSIAGWYANLVKPALNPPSWIFGPVWTTLFVLMGIALFLVWKKHSTVIQSAQMLRIWKLGIILFVTQLILNTLWSILFFGLESPAWALVEIVILWFAILATIITFYKISKPTLWLLLPYILWVSFAGYLNYAIWSLN